MADDARIEESQRAAWSGLSAAWERWDTVITAQLAPVGASMIEALRLPEDARHLDAASGTGEPGLTVARLHPSARVVLTDLSPEMLAVARRRAEAQGATNVETRVCSADDVPFADHSFDTVSVRFGHMFFPDPARATVELARVMRPGGRLCSAVWVEPARNPWTSVAMDAIAAEIALPPPDPEGPSMYRCAAPGQVSALLEGAGLVDVAEWDVEVELATASEGEYWEVITEHVSLAAAALRSVDEATRSRARARALDSVARYVVDGSVRVPGLARCIVGTKPASG
jgi:ubiquinone/menaquinone biosynthesis C-methylase UbiE